MLEILAPAGNAECAVAAIQNGADAIYLGLSSFSARQSAENFDEAGFCDILKRAHFCGVKVYVAMNTIIKEMELDDFFHNVLKAWNLGADAIILQDVFLGKLIHEQYPQIVLHLSTQAGVCNEYGATLARDFGFSRVILARETPLEEIKKIATIIETEVFVQGALCTAFSGQCYFSSFVGGNSGNRGRCKQPCRKLYAYNRNGNTEKNYALSLSDLCVGEYIEKLIDAGVVSFKIEGRMRREEYVAAAVRYYRILLDKKAGADDALSDLKRTYNRGNYTKGLAFGQDKRFLSTAIQGHLGEKVGVVKVINGKFFVESKKSFQNGDAFKILRDGKEVCGATFLKSEGKGFTIYSKSRLKNGDGVFITTDTAVNERVKTGNRRGMVALKLKFVVGERAVVEARGFRFESEEILQTASTRPLTVDELKTCFMKADGLPIDVSFEDITLTGDIFIPKSQLNSFRRYFYSALADTIMRGNNKQYEFVSMQRCLPKGGNFKRAIISNDFNGVNVDVAIYKADDLKAVLPQNFIEGKFEKYLYYPAFLTTADCVALEKRLLEASIDGIYAENYGGLLFAQKHGLKVFAGLGLNLINSLSIAIFLHQENAAYYAISKEANAQEGNALAGEKAFVLSSGNIKLMDLCYCPFERHCSNCDKKDIYTLSDIDGRNFPVRRYVSANGECRFEVYNCADLISSGLKNVGQLMDLTLVQDKKLAAEANREEAQKQIYQNYTSGHFKRGVL